MGWAARKAHAIRADAGGFSDAANAITTGAVTEGAQRVQEDIDAEVSVGLAHVPARPAPQDELLAQPFSAETPLAVNSVGDCLRQQRIKCLGALRFSDDAGLTQATQEKRHERNPEPGRQRRRSRRFA
jgi:hypothetical protein